MKFIENFFVNVFRRVQAPFQMDWMFRVRYVTNQSAWIIEIDEGGMEGWKPVAHRVKEANFELVTVNFPNYYQARQYAADTGLDVGYQEMFYNSKRPELEPFQRRAESTPLPSLGDVTHQNTVRPMSAALHRHHAHPGI